MLAIDIETYSEADLKKVGVYKYASDPSFELLLFAYSLDGGPVEVVRVAEGEKIPMDIIFALNDPTVTKTAFNANFERTCLAEYLQDEFDPEGWECTRVLALRAGLPGNLAGVGAALGIEQQKMTEGKKLIQYFCSPCRPTKTNGGRTRNFYHHDPAKWETFVAYCKRDVEAEMEIRSRLGFVEVDQFETELYYLDQRINDRGVRLDRGLVNAAVWADEEAKRRYTDEARTQYGLENPKSTDQMKERLGALLGREVKSLTKQVVADLLKDPATPEGVIRLLELRQRLAKSSVAKYTKMAEVMDDDDDRVRGLYQFYGANRTGRFAGRLLQPQNLTKNETEPLDVMRQWLKEGRLDDLDMYFRPVPFVLSELVRTAFIASRDKTLIVSDFSAIEARVLAWLAGEDWRLEVFAGDGKIYEASAAQMFHVPIESITKGNPLRQKGKVAELACGYGGGLGALKQMGADRMGLTDQEIIDIVCRWRDRSPHIVKFWHDLEAAFQRVIGGSSSVRVGRVTVEPYELGVAIRLPSGRCLYYMETSLRMVGGKVNIMYKDVHQSSGKWLDTKTYGGKLVENVTQAVARDCLAVAMMRLEAEGFPIVMHVHDEVVIEGEPGSLHRVNEILAQPIDWAEGLILKGDGYETKYYRKD